MAISLDAIATAYVNGGPSVTTLTSNNHTVGTGATILLVFLTISGQPAAISAWAGHWDTAGTNQVLTVVQQQNDANSNAFSILFGLVNPTAGNKTLTVTWTGASQGTLNSMSLFGTVSTSVAAACVNAAGSSGVVAGATPTLPLTGTAGGANRSVALLAEINTTVTGLNATSSTLIGVVDNTETQVGTAASRAPSAASVTWTGTPVTADIGYAMVGCDVVAAPDVITFGWRAPAVSFF